MRQLLKIILFAISVSVVSAGASSAQPTDRDAPKGGVLSLLPAPQTTQHSITTSAGKLDYTATAGTLSRLAATAALPRRSSTPPIPLRRRPGNLRPNGRSRSCSMADRELPPPISILARSVHAFWRLPLTGTFCRRRKN